MILTIVKVILLNVKQQIGDCIKSVFNIQFFEDI
jgi:hypothetical protein